MGRVIATTVVLSTLMIAPAAARALIMPGHTTALSLNASGGAFGNQASDAGNTPAITPDGRYVAFMSSASNLAPGVVDDNAAPDVYVRDLLLHTTRLVSTTAAATAGDGSSTTPYISADGRYVAFTSQARNLVAGITDTALSNDVFVRDMQTQTTQILTTLAGTTTALGGQARGIGGTRVLFTGNGAGHTPQDTSPDVDVFVADLPSLQVTQVDVAAAGGSPGNGGVAEPEITPDGRYVTFDSPMSTLVGAALDDNAGASDVFRRDLQAQSTVLVSAKPNGHALTGGASRPTISADGRFVAFETSGVDATTGITDGNAAGTDIARRDVESATSKLVNISTNPTATTSQGAFSPHISGDGRYVAYQTNATDAASASDIYAMTDVVWRDMSADVSRWVDVAPPTYLGPGAAGAVSQVISRDGRYVYYRADGDAVPQDTNATTDIYRRDMIANTLPELVSASHTGVAGNGVSYLQNFVLASNQSALTPDASSLAFASQASDLTTLADGNGVNDLFVRGNAHPVAAFATAIDHLHVSFDASPSLDDAGIATYAWSFGDSTTGSGALVTHDYVGTQTFQVTLTVTDADGATSSTTLPVSVVAPTIPIGVLNPDTTSPVVSKLSVSPRRFRVSSKSTVTSATAKKAPAGTTIKLTLSEAATVKLGVARTVPGLRIGKRCKRRTAALKRKNRKARACTVLVSNATLTRKLASGATRLAFSGRIGRTALKPGGYRLTAVATDAAKNASAPATAGFVIVRR